MKVENFKVKNIQHAHPKIINVITEMIVKQELGMSFYGQFALYINFKCNNKIPTAGVYVAKTGMQMVYNEDFINSLTHRQTRFLMIHEMLHLISDHGNRRDKWNADATISNINQDQIINTEITRCYDNHTDYPDVDKDGFKLYIPPEYEDEEIWEILYEWSLKLKKDHKDKFDKYEQRITDDVMESVRNQLGKMKIDTSDDNSNNNGSGGGDSNTPQTQSNNNSNSENSNDKDSKSDTHNWIDNEIEKDFPGKSKEFKDTIKALAGQGKSFDEHLKNEVNDELAKHQVDRALEVCKNRGLVGENEERLLGKLRKRKKDYTKEIKRAAQNLRSSTKNRTFIRPNRKGLQGLKGRFKKQIDAINCIIDTSGSMSEDIELMLSYIFKSDLYINLIQIDTDVKSVTQISSITEFKNIEMKGFGGTILQPAVDYVMNTHSLKNLNTLILTDGYTDSLSLEGMKTVVILSSGTQCPIQTEPRKLRQVIINRDSED